MKNDKRFELTMSSDLYEFCKLIAEKHDISVAKLIRTLLTNLSVGQINLDSEAPRPLTIDNNGECSYVTKSDPLTLYEFSLVASRHGMSRIELTKLIQQAVVDGRISIDILTCGCYQ